MSFKQKNVLAPIPAPTLEQRHAAQERRSQAALGIFHTAAAELEIAADELDKIAAEAQEIAEAHYARYEAADEAAAANRANAAKIKGLFN